MEKITLRIQLVFCNFPSNNFDGGGGQRRAHNSADDAIEVE